VSFRTTTDRLSNVAGDTRLADVTSIWNAGVDPIASALARNRLSSDRSWPSTITIETGSLGDSTQWNALSAGSGSDPAWIDPRTLAPTRVNGEKVTDDEARGATVALAVSMSWPSTVSTTGTSFSGSSPLLLRPAVTVTRSCPENAARPNETEGTD